MGEGYGILNGWLILSCLESPKGSQPDKGEFAFIKEDPLRPPRTIPQTQQVPFDEIMIPYDQVISR